MANYTILLIDYEPRSIERFRDPLISAGYAVEVATDGVSGIEAFHRLNPDMVLVEAMIPKKHGFEVCQELKRTPHGRQTPVIITTGVYKGRKYRTQALHIYGCDEYIEKPIAPEQLLALVGKFFVAGSPSASGASGSSASSTGGADSEPVASEPGRGPSARGTADAIAKPTSPVESRAPRVERAKPTLVAPAAGQDATEDEIMARLDEILPGARPAPAIAKQERTATVATVEQNPFAQMRAELDAELGSISGPLAFEIAPKLVPMPEPFPTDQAVSPSVLEALPIPDAVTPISPLPAEIPATKEEQPGQVVSFDTKRSRKNRKSEKQGIGSSQKGTQIASSPKTIAPIAVDPPIRVAEVAVPRGTIVESEIESPAGRRGKPVVLWLAAAAVALAAVYLVFPRGDSSLTNIVPASRPTTKSVTTTPPVVEPPPVASAPVESIAPTPEPLPTVPDKPKPAAAPLAVKTPPPKKAADRVAATTPAPTAAGPRKAPAAAQTAADAQPTGTKLSKPEPEPSAPTAIETAAVPPPTAAAPSTLDTSAAGAEAVSDAAPSTKIEPGTLIAIDEADTLPVPLTHRSPFYSPEAIQLRVSGTVIMNVLINDHGTVDQVVLVTGVVGGDVNDAAVRAAKSWTYRPATKNGVPVKVWRSEQVVVKP